MLQNMCTAAYRLWDINAYVYGCNIPAIVIYRFNSYYLIDAIWSSSLLKIKVLLFVPTHKYNENNNGGMHNQLAHN